MVSFQWWRWGIPAPVEPEPPVDPLAWTILAPSTGPGRVAGVIDGKLYIAGAFAPPSTALYCYDFATGTWSTKAAMPTPLAASVGGVIDGKLHVVTGYTGSTRQTTHYAYDPVTNAWSAKAPIGTARDNAFGAVVGGKLYVAGGSTTSAYLATMEVYDPTTNTWTTKAPMPGARAAAAAAALNGKLYVVGGLSQAELLEYDPAANLWTPRTPLASANPGASLCAAGGRLYMSGGSSTYNTQLWRYNPADGTWTRLVDLPAGRSNHWSVVHDGVLHIGGPGNAFWAYAAPDFDPAPEPEPEPSWILDEDRSSALMSWTITYGRQDSTEKAAPTTATVGLGAARAGACPVAGERFRLAIDGEPRFTGETTDPKIDPPARTYAVVGAGRLGRARRRPIKGGRTYPLALDGARVARILDDAADGELEVAVDTGTALILPPTRTVSAGQLLDLTSDSTGGQLVEQLDGAVEWHDADHRRGVPVSLTLDAGEILNDLTFEQHVGDLVNEAEISYGYDAATVRVTDPVSIDAREAYPASVSTALANQSDAHDLGTYLVGRRSEPIWQLPNLLVDLGRGVDPVKRAALLALRYGERIAVTGLPALAPYAADVELYVEGITETARVPRPGHLEWRLSIAVSDPMLSGVAVRVMDAPPTLTVDGVDPTLTVLDTARIEDPTDLEA